MGSTLNSCTNLVLFSEFDSSLYAFDRSDLSDVNRNQSLVTGNSRIIVDITIAISILPSYQG
jgi:hypothetical protein